MNSTFNRIKGKMSQKLRKRIEKLEKPGLYGHGKDYEKNRYTAEYLIAAWGEGFFFTTSARTILKQTMTLPQIMAWDLYREIWGSHNEFVVDGNLTSVEYTDQFSSFMIPTLIAVGDNEQCDLSPAMEMNEKIPGSKLVILPKAGT